MYKTQHDILRRFSEDFSSFVDDGIANFAKEAEFYLIYVNYMKNLERMGYRFAIPSFTDGGIYVRKFYRRKQERQDHLPEGGRLVVSPREGWAVRPCG